MGKGFGEILELLRESAWVDLRGVLFWIALELVLRLLESSNAKDSINPAIKTRKIGLINFAKSAYCVFILSWQALAAAIYATIIPCF